MMANQVTTKQPSSAQFIASSIALLLLSAFLAPFSLVFVAAARLLAHLSYPQRSPIPGPVVLINGAKVRSYIEIYWSVKIG